MGVRKITLERRMRSFGTSVSGKKVMHILHAADTVIIYATLYNYIASYHQDLI